MAPPKAPHRVLLDARAGADQPLGQRRRERRRRVDHQKKKEKKRRRRRREKERASLSLLFLEVTRGLALAQRGAKSLRLSRRLLKRGGPEGSGPGLGGNERRGLRWRASLSLKENEKMERKRVAEFSSERKGEKNVDVDCLQETVELFLSFCSPLTASASSSNRIRVRAEHPPRSAPLSLSQSASEIGVQLNSTARKCPATTSNHHHQFSLSTPPRPIPRPRGAPAAPRSSTRFPTLTA
jgi:hypothetical protein